MENAKIYIDFDDVIGETCRVLVNLANSRFGKNADWNAIHDFDLHNSLSLGNDEYEEFMDIFHKEELLKIQEVPGAVAVINGWHEAGLRPTVVTGRPPNSHAHTVQWLDEHGLGWIEALHVDKYGRFADVDLPYVIPVAKLPEQGFQFAVEDAPLSCERLVRTKMCPFAIYARPWNASYTPPAGTDCHRFDSWLQIDEDVRRRFL